MSIRGPAIAVAAMLLLTGCGRGGLTSCSRTSLEQHAWFKGRSAGNEFHPNVGASARDSHHEGREVAKEGAEHVIKEGIKEGITHRDNDDTKRDQKEPDPAKYTPRKSANEDTIRGLTIK